MTDVAEEDFITVEVEGGKAGEGGIAVEEEVAGRATEGATEFEFSLSGGFTDDGDAGGAWVVGEKVGAAGFIH